MALQAFQLSSSSRNISWLIYLALSVVVTGLMKDSSLPFCHSGAELIWSTYPHLAEGKTEEWKAKLKYYGPWEIFFLHMKFLPELLPEHLKSQRADFALLLQGPGTEQGDFPEHRCTWAWRPGCECAGEQLEFVPTCETCCFRGSPAFEVWADVSNCRTCSLEFLCPLLLVFLQVLHLQAFLSRNLLAVWSWTHDSLGPSVFRCFPLVESFF